MMFTHLEYRYLYRGRLMKKVIVVLITMFSILGSKGAKSQQRKKLFIYCNGVKEDRLYVKFYDVLHANGLREVIGKTNHPDVNNGLLVRSNVTHNKKMHIFAINSKAKLNDKTLLVEFLYDEFGNMWNGKRKGISLKFDYYYVDDRPVQIIRLSCRKKLDISF